jgi:hypothetical protein
MREVLAVVRLIRRLLVGFFLANLFFALGTAAAAAITRRRLEDDAPPEPGDNDLEVRAIFGGAEFSSQAPALRTVRAIAWFGGLELDLRGATVDPQGARLRLGSLYGGLDVVLPDDWQVTLRRIGVFGAVEGPVEPVAAAPASGPIVEISAVAVFGGVSIRRAGAAGEIAGSLAG